VESAETKASAERAYAKGSRLLEQGNAVAAIDSLREAHALERQNPQYSLELVSALIAADRTREAAPVLDSVLSLEPNDGEANLIAARLAVKTGMFVDAQAYYHRAIYGQWGEAADRQRQAVRMELINLLVRKNDRQELLGELIELAAQPSLSLDVQRRIAELFLVADAPGRAAAIYQMLIDHDPKDMEAYGGLGNAELRLGRYRAAHDAYERVFLGEPNNSEVRAHLQVLNLVTQLDPTLRQLTSLEKYRRSIRILQMVRESLERCETAKRAGGTPDLVKAADATIGSREPAHVTNEAAEEVLATAEKLWHAQADCPEAKTPDMNPLALLMRKLAT
jgi:tetratricopeptide (TPR) repeat protein